MTPRAIEALEGVRRAVAPPRYPSSAPFVRRVLRGALGCVVHPCRIDSPLYQNPLLSHCKGEGKAEYSSCAAQAPVIEIILQN